MFATNTTYEISWLKMGSRISSSNPKYQVNMVPGKFKKYSTKLCIKSLNKDDSGIYSCEIKYARKRAYAEGILQVLGKYFDKTVLGNCVVLIVKLIVAVVLLLVKINCRCNTFLWQYFTCRASKILKIIAAYSCSSVAEPARQFGLAMQI